MASVLYTSGFVYRACRVGTCEDITFDNGRIYPAIYHLTVDTFLYTLLCVDLLTQKFLQNRVTILVPWWN